MGTHLLRRHRIPSFWCWQLQHCAGSTHHQLHKAFITCHKVCFTVDLYNGRRAAPWILHKIGDITVEVPKEAVPPTTVCRASISC